MSTSTTLTASDALPAMAEHTRFTRAVEQLRFLAREMSAGRSGLMGLAHFLANCFRGGRVAIAAYRCKRFWLLLLGPAHGVSLLWMWPIYLWCRLLGGRHEIVAQAEFGPGLRLIHCSMACVVTPFAVAGKNLYLTGGNVIGRRRKAGAPGDVWLGNDVMLGIGSMVIGPISIGDGARIGAGAVVVKDLPSGATVVSSPVRVLI
jgi:serine acetyltransferase